MHNEKDKELRDSLLDLIRLYNFMLNHPNLASAMYNNAILHLVNKNLKTKKLSESEKVIFFHAECIVRLFDLQELLAKKIVFLWGINNLQRIHSNQECKHYLSLNEVEITEIDFYSNKTHNNMEELEQDIQTVKNKILPILSK